MQITVEGEPSGIAAFEFKTGRVAFGLNNYHRAQVLLYTLLMSDRYDTTVLNGLLTYISGNNVQAGKENLSQGGEHSSVVVAARAELVGLIMARNNLAGHVALQMDKVDEVRLPPLIQGRQMLCEKCFAVDSCMIQHKLSEGGTAETVTGGPGEALFAAKTKHLTTKHAEYYNSWHRSIRQEETHVLKLRSELWTLGAEAREKLGRCWSYLRLDPKVSLSSR